MNAESKEKGEVGQLMERREGRRKKRVGGAEERRQKRSVGSCRSKEGSHGSGTQAEKHADRYITQKPMEQQNDQRWDSENHVSADYTVLIKQLEASIRWPPWRRKSSMSQPPHYTFLNGKLY